MEVEEVKDILFSIAAITLIFVWPHILLLENWLIAFIVVVVAFFLHELAHRAVSRHFGFVAFYRMFKEGLALSILFTMISQGRIKFIMPGAVIIYPALGLWGWGRTYPTRKETGLISLAGPLTNLLIALICLLPLYTIPLPVLVGKILTWLVAIDVWLAFFNLMPLGPLDGMKILAWDWRVWLLVTGCAGFLLFFV